MQGAVRSGVTDSFAGAVMEGVAAVQAGQTQAALLQVVLWASWRLLGWVMAVVAGLVLVGWLASMLVLW